VAARLGVRVRTGWAAVGAPLLVSRTRPETDAERRNGNRHHGKGTFGEACQVNPQDPLTVWEEVCAVGWQ
jgi:hypothetical protein